MGNIEKSIEITISLINKTSKQASSIITSFSSIEKKANDLLSSIKSLNNSLNSLKSTSNISNLSKDLKSLSVDNKNTKNIEKLLNELEKLKNIKFPSFDKFNEDLEKHEKIVKRISVSYKDMNNAISKLKIKNIVSESNSATKSIQKLDEKTKKSKTSFSQLGFAIGSASTGLSKFGTRIYGVTRGFSAISKEMGVAMSAFTIAFTSLFAIKGIVSDISKFDDAIRTAGSVAQASSVQLTQLSDAARAMGESTRYTAVDAANALTALAMTGLDVNESIATLPTVLNVAAAANMSLGESADIVTNIMVGYGKTVGDLPRIADLMTAAFTNANTSLSEIGVALKYVGPVANSAGLSLEETTGILASLANAGYRGSKAGVILRTSIANLLAPTGKMKEVMRDYGIAMTDLTKSDGSMRSFTSILEVMKEKGVKTGDALTLFGKRAGPGILALLEQGIPAIEEMNAKIAESEGVALKVAYEMEAGLGGALRRLKSMWDEVSIAIGKVIEQDVEKFISNLTKSLNKNKDQIVGFVSSLFEVFQVLAKVGVGIANFVTNHIKLVAAITAISVAINVLSTSSKGFMSIGIIKYLSGMFSSVKWSGIATGISSIATSLNSYTAASKSAAGVGAVSSITNLGGFNFSSVTSGLKSIGSALLSLGVSAAKATVAFIAANPVLAAVAAAAGIAYAAIKILDKDYEGAAKKSLKMATATKDANRELEYQLAELKLINNEFKRSGAKDYSNAEQRLQDVIKKTNLSLEEKIEYLKKASKGSEEAKNVIKKLTDIIKDENDANDAKIIADTVKAREAQSKAVEEQAKNLEYYYGISIDGQSRLNALESIAAATNTLKPILWLKKKLGYLDENIQKYDELKTQQLSIDKSYQDMIAQMVVAGKSTDEFRAALEKSGESSETINTIAKSFENLKKEASENTEVMNNLEKMNAESLNAIESNAKRQIDIYKESSNQRTAIQKQTLYNISVLEAEGKLTHESAEMAKLQATLDSAEKQIQSAKTLYDSIDEIAVESKENAMEEITKAENKAADIKLKILENISKSEEKLNEKISSFNSKRTQELSENEKKLSELRENLNKKHEDAETQKTEKIAEIEQKLGDKLESIEDKLAEKRAELQEKRVQEIVSSAQKIAGIESSTEDKIRSIQQRGMTDEQKNNSDREAAAKKLKEGEELVAKAKADGDTAALERGTKLIEQSSDLYSSLKDESEAVNGVTESSELLKEAEKVRSELALKSIDEKIKAEENAANRLEEIAKETAAREKEKEEVGYSKKIEEANEFYNNELQKENENHSRKIAIIDAEISKNNNKLQVIQNEKALVLELISQYEKMGNIGVGVSGWKETSEATRDAINSVSEYSGAIEGLNDHEVNIKFTGEASPKAPLGEKLKEITDKFSEINSEIEVNVKFSSEGKDLSSGIKEFQKNIESIQINVPISADVKELEAVISLINKYKEMGIKISVKVDSGELNKVSDILKNMVNKTVALTLKVIGYDDLVKAKNMIDNIKSKTVTVTTRQKTVTEKAAGGYIEPEKYATGGNVFRRLSSPYIGTGSGKKDDVPAMLMKGEFVQKVSAVKKYGKDFMAKLNAGLIPQKIIKMFNSGGDVQPEYYASGGHVGYENLPKKYKKKIFDLLNQNVSDIKNKPKDQNIITEMGESSINKMTNVFSDSVLKFASGGNISQGNYDINKEKTIIMKEYARLIEEEENSGNTKIAEVMTLEQNSLLELSNNLKDELSRIKDEYDEYVAEATISYENENSDIDSVHDENTKSINDTYNNNIIEEENNKKDKEKDTEKEYNEKKLQYENEKSQIELNYENVAQEIYKNIIDEKTKLREIADDLYNFGKKVKTAADYSNMWESTGEGTEILSDYKPAPYDADKDNPSEKYIQILLGTIKDNDSKKNDFKLEFEKLWSDFLSSKGNLIDFGIANPIWLLKGLGIKDLEKHAKRISDSRKKESIKEVDDSFSAEKEDYSLKKTEININYEDAINSLKDTKETDLFIENESYKNEKADSKTSFDEIISKAKISYNDNVLSANENYTKDVDSVKKSSKNEIDSIRDEVKVNISNLEKEKKDQINSLIESQKEDKVLDKSAKDISDPKDQSSIYDLLKKKLKIFGFNTGGYVNSTADSIPGKDSILSVLTPNEYVMKASVVRKFGKGFFDSLNNFRIPQFNMGGIVNGAEDTKISSTSTTRYALDLSINGSKQEELIGSQMGIQSLINELSMAKLSAG